MTILYDPRRSVNRNRTFGLGVAKPAERRLPVGPSVADAQWWAENAPSNRYGFEVFGPSDAEMDRMARESAELDRTCRGSIL